MPPPSEAVLGALLSALARMLGVCAVLLSNQSDWTVLRGLAVFALGVSSAPFLQSAWAVARALASGGGDDKQSGVGSVALQDQCRFLGGLALAASVGTTDAVSTVALRLAVLLLLADALVWSAHAAALFGPWACGLAEEARTRHRARWALTATTTSTTVAPEARPPPSPPTSPPPMPLPTASTAPAKSGKLESALFGKLLDEASRPKQSARSGGGALKLRVI